MARYSSQRELILSILRSTKSHPSAAAIYEEARKIMPNISLGTVYRNLANLCESGEITAISCSDLSRFDATTDFHPHFCCKICKRVFDLELDPETVKESVLGFDGCEVEGITVVLNGVCRECKRKIYGGKEL